MIASRRGLAILGALALLALVLVLVDRPRTRAPLDRAVVPGLDVAHLTSLRWESADAPALALAPSPTAPAATDAPAWRFVEPAYGAVDRAALSNVVAALRGARWHRRDDASAAGEATRALVIRDGAREHVVRFGRALEGAEQAWLVVDGHALLVDAWVARALDPGALALAVRRPFEGAERGSIRLGDERLDGHPRVAFGPPALPRVIVAASLVEEAERALAGLELQRLVPGAPPPPPTKASAVSHVAPGLLELRAGDVTGLLGGVCPGAPALVSLRASTGSGCVTAEAADRLRAIAATLAGPAKAYVERRLVPVEPVQLTLADGGVLDLHKRARIDGAPADPARVAELLAALAAPAELATSGPSEDKPRSWITVEHAGGTLVLELFTDHIVRRKNEYLSFQLSQPAWDLLARPSRALRELALWAEEPTTLTRIELDGVTYQRGAVVGEWTREQAGAAGVPVAASLAAQLEALATTFAAPRPIAAEAPAFAPRHRVALVITPPAGASVTHRLELGAPGAKGCPARADGTAILLPRATCAAVDALAR